MMRSLFSGVSGVKGHQTRMDVIGNNIANVNTTGFKYSRTTFADMFSQTVGTAAGPQGSNLGGINPKQVGLGVGVASIDLITTDGAVQSTGKNTDLCLSGNALFGVKSGDEMYYTRNGAFEFDANGNYVLPGTGMFVQGWGMENQIVDADTGLVTGINTTGQPGNITIPADTSLGPQRSKTIGYSGNLDSGTELGQRGASTISTVYSQYGDSYAVPIDFYKTEIVGTTPGGLGVNWLVNLDPDAMPDDIDTNGFHKKVEHKDYKDGSYDEKTTTVATHTVTYTYSDGTSETVTPPTQPTIPTNAYITQKVDDWSCPTKLDHYDAPTKTLTTTPGTETFQLTTKYDEDGNVTSVTGNSPWSLHFNDYGNLDWDWVEIESDFIVKTGAISKADGTEWDTNFRFTKESVTQYQASGGSTIHYNTNDGYTYGTLSEVMIDNSGIMTGVFSNSQRQQLAQVAVYQFNNFSGLNKTGNSFYQPSNNSGEPAPGTVLALGVTLTSSALEMSNVDVADQFSDMIITQRGFQSNSKIVTVSDEMLETLINMKR